MSDGKGINEETFSTFADLIKRGVSPTQIAMAMELEGFFAWDGIGRYVRVPPGEGGGSIRESLRDRAFSGLTRLYGEQNGGVRTPYPSLMDVVEDWEIDPDHIFHSGGWPTKSIPDFEGVHERWNTQEYGAPSAPVRPHVPVGIGAPKRKNEWSDCITDAFKRYVTEHDAEPSAGQLWAYMTSRAMADWKVTKPEPKVLQLSNHRLNLRNFKARLKRYKQPPTQ